MSYPGFVAACLFALWGTTALCGQVPPAGQVTESRPRRARSGASGRPPWEPVPARVPRRQVRRLEGGRHSQMIQPANAATVLGDFRRRPDPAREAVRLRAANGELYITESSLSGTGRASRRLHPGQPPHPALPDDHRPAAGSSSCRRAGTSSARSGSTTSKSSGPDEEAGAPVQQWNKNCVGCHVSQQDNTTRPRPEPTRRRGWTSGPRASAATGRAARTLRASALDERRPPRPAPRSSGRRASTRATSSRSARSATRCVTSPAPGFRAGEDY